MKIMEKKKISLYEISDILQHNAVLTISDNVGKNYGTGDNYTPVETHTVSYIADHPGCTATEIAYNWGKTIGAVSQIIKKLRSYELVTAYRDVNDEKRVLLSLTEKGKELDRCHRIFDEQSIGQVYEYLEDIFTANEINTAFLVLKKYVEIYCKLKADSKKISAASQTSEK